MVRSSVPPTARSASRIASASSRRGVHPPEEPVLRVDLRGRRVVVAAHLVGAREHDQPVHRLDRPAPLDEAAGQPVEQLGLAGRSPSVPKLSGVRTRPWPKCQRQIRLTITRPVSGWSAVDQPAGQLQPAALRPAPIAGGRRRRGRAGTRLGTDSPERQVVAADVDRRVGDLALRRRPSPTASRRRLLQRGQFVAQPLELGLRLLGIERLRASSAARIPSPPAALSRSFASSISSSIASFLRGDLLLVAALRARSSSVGQRVLVPPGDLLEATPSSGCS